MSSCISIISEKDLSLLEAVKACGQGALLEGVVEIDALFDLVRPLESLYSDLGGIVGYQEKVLELMQQGQGKGDEVYMSPPVWDLRDDEKLSCEAVEAGLQALPFMAEMWPLGGAADRLMHRDSDNGDALPAATFVFMGKTLLQGLVEDLQAREYLYFQRTGEVVITPLAIMTSHEKKNHRRIVEMFEQSGWFGRPRESIRFFTQPLVPVVDEAGQWCLKKGGGLLCKPGGHGAVWKLAQEAGILAWLRGLGRTKALVRQVNNPVAGCDFGLLALSGIGWKYGKDFGVASCPRVVGAKEGMVVLKEGAEHRCISNIEYCDFKRKGIVDRAAEGQGNHSLFPSNTNILFVDLAAIEQAIAKEPFPGLLVNQKVEEYASVSGEVKKGKIARLESMMQNIADVLGDPKEVKPDQLRTFATFNHRKKTISCTKKKYRKGGSLLETPQGCLLDVLANARELLKRYCGMEVPEGEFHFRYHPALGPLYTEIAKKLRGGSLFEGSSLDLQLAHLSAEELHVAGVLQVVALSPMGQGVGGQHYSKAGGRCSFKNVRVQNRGKGLERARIEIAGDGEFHATDITLKGDMHIVVPTGIRMEAIEREGVIALQQIKKASQK